MIKTQCKVKKAVSIMLAVIILAASILTIWADNSLQPMELSDLTINGVAHWAKVYIDSLVQKGIIVGYPDGTFKPDNSVEVDAFIKMVVVSLGYDIEKGTDYWALPYINKAKELKLIDGTEFNTYRRIINREEAAKIIVNALAINEQLPSEEQINKYITRVPDYLKISSQYRKYALYAYATGLIVGNQSGYFNPINNLTRAEASIFVMKLLDASLRQPIDIDEYLSGTLPELLKTDEEVWGREDIRQRTSMAEYELKYGKLYFTDGRNFKDVLPKETLNPEVNRQIHDLVKVLIDDNHFVRAAYTPESEPDLNGTIIPSITHVMFSKDYGYAYNDVSFFTFRFADVRPFSITDINSKFSDKASIALSLDSLWWDYKEDGNEYNPLKDGWRNPYYAEKLNKSFIALFGTDTGNKIYQFVHGIYMNERIYNLNNRNMRVKNTTIDNIQIDFYNNAAELNFYFTIK